MTSVDSLEKFLEVQLQTWNHVTEERIATPGGPVIALTREPGCHGETIARALASELGLDLYDWEILEQIAKDAHVSERTVATLDEKLRTTLEDWLANFAGGSNLSSYHYSQCLRRVLYTVAAHGNAVILGRGANFLIPSERKTIGICLVAPLEVRVQHIMQKLHLSEKSALKHISVAEREQRLWVKQFCHADITEASLYHMVINTSLISTGGIVRVVKEFLATEMNSESPLGNHSPT
jgi:cytidylate kinase